MKIVHISGDYSKQGLYKCLVEALGDANIEQEMYVPVRSHSELGANGSGHKNVKVQYSKIISPMDKLLFRRKIRKIKNWISNDTRDWSDTILHGHFFYSDGAVALGLHERFGCPFVVTVRNTDINVFNKFRPDLRSIALKILRAASWVIFPNFAYKDRFFHELGIRDTTLYENKAKVIPNGIDNFWFDDKVVQGAKTKDAETVKILFVGDNTKNKNFNLVVRAASFIALSRKVELAVVGRTLKVNIADSLNLTIVDYGRVNKHKLRELYHAADVLTVPSFHETFGLAYIECLSCGTPAIHSKGEAIAGYWKAGGPVIEIDPYCEKSLVDGILQVINRDIDFEVVREKVASDFTWSNVALRLIKLYRSS
jgi:glycosyltransferase involved in cell wall biosynthesis